MNVIQPDDYDDGYQTAVAASHQQWLGVRRYLNQHRSDLAHLRVSLYPDAITTLTFRRDRRRGTANFLLHWREPDKVATADGLYDAIPAGEFQPSSLSAWDQTNDVRPLDLGEPRRRAAVLGRGGSRRRNRRSRARVLRMSARCGRASSGWKRTPTRSP